MSVNDHTHQWRKPPLREGYGIARRVTVLMPPRARGLPWSIMSLPTPPAGEITIEITREFAAAVANYRQCAADH